MSRRGKATSAPFTGWRRQILPHSIYPIYSKHVCQTGVRIDQVWIPLLAKSSYDQSCQQVHSSIYLNLLPEPFAEKSSEFTPGIKWVWTQLRQMGQWKKLAFNISSIPFRRLSDRPLSFILACNQLGSWVLLISPVLRGDFLKRVDCMCSAVFHIIYAHDIWTHVYTCMYVCMYVYEYTYTNTHT